MSITGSGNPNLINCEACQKEISTLADKCPGCGAPNNLVNPNITHVLENMPALPGKYWVWNDKTKLWGNTEEKFRWWMWLIIFFCAAPGFAFGIIPGLIIAPIAYFALLKMYGVKKEFVADLQAGTWQSNDEEFWKPIRSMMDV